MRSVQLLRCAGAFALVVGLAGLSSASAAASKPGAVVVGKIHNQVDELGTSIAPIQVLAGDTTPGQTLTYSQTGLPVGLSIGAATGLISGTIASNPDDGGAFTVTITVTDTSAASASTSFRWDVHGVIKITAAPPGSVLLDSGAPFSSQVKAQDSVPGQHLTYSLVPRYSLPGAQPNVLPAGLTLSSGGLISGVTATLPGRRGVAFVMTAIFVSDDIGAQASAIVLWNIELNPGVSLPGPIKAAAARECVSVGGPVGRGSRIVEISRCSGSVNQQWQVGQDGTLRALGLCLAAGGGRPRNGMTVLGAACTGTGSLSFRQAWNNQGSEVFNYSANRCLTDPSRTSRSGTRLELSTCRRSAAMSWQLPAGPFISTVDGLCASDQGAREVKGAEVVLAPCTGGKAQRWTAELDNTIRVEGKCLGVTGPRAAGAKVQLLACSGSIGEYWYSFPGGEVINLIKRRLCLTAPSSGKLDGAQLRVATCTGATAERWRLR